MQLKLSAPNLLPDSSIPHNRRGRNSRRLKSSVYVTKSERSFDASPTVRQQSTAPFPRPQQQQYSERNDVYNGQDAAMRINNGSQYETGRGGDDVSGQGRYRRGQFPEPRRRQEPPEDPRYQSSNNAQELYYQDDPYQRFRQQPGPPVADQRDRLNQQPSYPNRQPISQRRGPDNYRIQRQLPRFSPPRGEDILAYGQVVNKEVISRGSGISMGVVSHFYTDPDTLSVVSANLRPKGILGNTPLQAKVGNVMLETFCQVGDVVLVHDESALECVPASGKFRGLPQDERAGLLNLVGCQICTSQGQSLGKVKSYSFSPDSGRINAFQYDEVGLSWLLPALIGTWEIGVEFVSMVDSTDAIILLPGAEARRKRVADGWLEVAFIGLQNIFADNGIEQMSEVSYAEGADEEWEAWRVKWAPYFLQHYNQLPPATRRDFDLFNRRYEQQARFVQPKYLPPARDMPPANFMEPPVANLQREVSNEGYPPRQDPRLRHSRAQQPGFEGPVNQQRAPQGGRQATASVPLYESRPQPSYRQQDADGRFGDPQDSAYPTRHGPSQGRAARPEHLLSLQGYGNNSDNRMESGSSPQFQEWLEQQEYREPMLRSQPAAYARSPYSPNNNTGRYNAQQAGGQDLSWPDVQPSYQGNSPSSSGREPSRRNWQNGEQARAASSSSSASPRSGKPVEYIQDAETPARGPALQGQNPQSLNNQIDEPPSTKAVPSARQQEPSSNDTLKYGNSSSATEQAKMSNSAQRVNSQAAKPLESSDRDTMWRNEAAEDIEQPVPGLDTGRQRN